MKYLEKYSEDEREAIVIVLAVVTDILELFQKMGIDGRSGLQKCSLRTALFILEETEQGRNWKDHREAVAEFIVAEFWQDQAKK